MAAVSRNPLSIRMSVVGSFIHLKRLGRSDSQACFPVSFGCRGDQPDVANTETEESGESQCLVPRVLEQCIGMRIVWMVQMMLVVQGQQDHEKDSVDDAHRHQEQRRRERS